MGLLSPLLVRADRDRKGRGGGAEPTPARGPHLPAEVVAAGVGGRGDVEGEGGVGTGANIARETSAIDALGRAVRRCLATGLVSGLEGPALRAGGGGDW